MKTKLNLLAIIAISAFLFSFYQQKPWPVPEKYAKMTNPVKGDAETIKAAKALWTKHCQSCHGKTGLGDGTKAAQLETELADFTTDEVQSQTDGALFYKTLEGRDEMPSFKKKISDEEEIWQLIAYVRSMKGK